MARANWNGALLAESDHTILADCASGVPHKRGNSEQMIEAETQTPLAVNRMDTESDEARAEVLRGLAKPAKELPCKLFYDKRG
ncbi:MAG: hypothetical protein AABY97_01265, partial [Chloroflexota bacterium]